jgi:ectoine hydroxylase-related dioxygenase (phytanoyl-CoA dioxygenase family)
MLAMLQVERARSLPEFAEQLEQNGFALWPDATGEESLQALREACSTNVVLDASARRSDQLYARRNLLADVPAVNALAQSETLRTLVRAVLGPEFTVVRALLFDKVPEANWRVGWHQDLVIPLAERHEMPGFSAWSVKAGVVHAKPPQSVLEQMLTLRVHLDDCHAANGPLRLIAGSHVRGEIRLEDVRATIEANAAATCIAAAGDVLAMRPLMLHASSPATEPTHRRVVHLEYARPCLPEPLRWPDWASD